MLQLPCVYFPHAPQISGLLPQLPITFLLPAPPRSLQPFLPVPPTLGLLFLENAHLGSPADSPVSGCPHLSQRVLTCLGVSSHVLGCPHPSRHVLTCLGVSSPVSGYPHLSQRVLICLGVSSHILGCPHPSQGVLTRLGMWCPYRSRGVLTHLGMSSPISACPHLSWRILCCFCHQQGCFPHALKGGRECPEDPQKGRCAMIPFFSLNSLLKSHQKRTF